MKIIKYLILTLVCLLSAFFVISIVFQGELMQYGKNNLAHEINNDGPYLFYENDSILSVNYIIRNKEQGFEIKSQTIKTDSVFKLTCYYPLDSSKFEIPFSNKIKKPKIEYNDNERIIAISDIESNFNTFKNFLIGNKVVDNQLNWVFGKGHLVLIGDFIDRSYFTTQVLWFIYKLEKDAEQNYGKVHYILGNHEIMNMQGDHRYAKLKYDTVSEILEKKQIQLYDTLSFIGKWMNSKNIIEKINGNLFVHAGLHPDLTKTKLTLEKINKIARKNYYKPYSPQYIRNKDEKLLLSSKSPYWYRGYFEDNLKQSDIDKSLNKFNAKTIIVGHTIQSKVNRTYKGKVIGIDVEHRKDCYKTFPKNNTEGLLIENNKYYRVFENGDKKEIN
jgi:hypothetical protein